MTTKQTNEEWVAIFEQAEKELPSFPIVHGAPSLGSDAFAKTIDHTLLKLDATAEKIDTLCEEAVRHNFRVGLFQY